MRVTYSATLICSLIVLVSCNSKPVTAPQTSSCLTDALPKVQFAGGATTLGENALYPEEKPAREHIIAPFDIDATEVTNVQFAKFVAATDYVTDAEKIQPLFNVKGGSVFVPPSATQPTWWQFVEGADWRHPEGPQSTIEGKDNTPVVQISFNDALAYATWAGRTLPTEAQWEHAAKAGSTTTFVWGDERAPQGVEQANTWQGIFPIQNTSEDGYVNLAPVGCYKANSAGLYDMIGNAWEWTQTSYQHSDGEQIYTIKGGSFLCAPNYCRRYRAAARQPQEAGLPTNHVGFRTVSLTP